MTGDEPIERDHWDIYAETMDLTIEGHRLIADELIFEAKSFGRWIASAWRRRGGALQSF